MVIIVTGIYTFLSQPPVPQPQNVYEYMQNNFNATISPYIGTTNITVYNSIIQLAGNPAKNLSPVTVYLGNVSKDNKTYIYFFGVEASGQSAVETYVLWSYLTSHNLGHTNFPAYDGSFVSSQASIPIIPKTELIDNVASSNPVLNELMIPLTYQQAASQSNATNTQFMGSYLANITVPEAYLFAFFGKGNFPQVDVVRTIGNRTMVCNGFSPFQFIQYNATSSTRFLGENMQAQTFGSLLPTTISMNANLNTLSSCVKTVEKWNGN